MQGAPRSWWRPGVSLLQSLQKGTSPAHPSISDSGPQNGREPSTVLSHHASGPLFQPPQDTRQGFKAGRVTSMSQ